MNRIQPGIDLALGFVPGDAIALLQTPRKLGALALDDVEVIIGQVIAAALGP